MKPNKTPVIIIWVIVILGMIVLVNNLFADCNFKQGQKITITWDARPDTEMVKSYWVLWWDSEHTKWNQSTPDTFMIFTGIERTTHFCVFAYNGQRSVHSDTVTAFLVDSVESDIPYAIAAAEIWENMGDDWQKSPGIHFRTDGEIITNIAFWVNRPETGYLEETFISTTKNFPHDGEYEFQMDLSIWPGSEIYLLINSTEYSIPAPAEGLYIRTLTLSKGNHKITIKAKVNPAFLKWFGIYFADFPAPGAVQGLKIIAE